MAEPVVEAEQPLHARARPCVRQMTIGRRPSCGGSYYIAEQQLAT